MKVTIAETHEYSGKAKQLLNTDEQRNIIDYLAEHPKAGELMEGTGGIRKLRWARPGMGKRGGVRVVYYFHNENMPLYLLTMFGKSEKDNLSKAQRNELAKLTKLLVKYWMR